MYARGDNLSTLGEANVTLSKQQPEILYYAMTKEKEGNDLDNDDSDNKANDGGQ